MILCKLCHNLYKEFCKILPKGHYEMSMIFKLHPQLAKDCEVVGELEVNLVLLLNNSQLPWFILVPKIANATELYELDKEIQQKITEESRVFSEAIMAFYKGDKLNLATIGNVVPQLHIHHIVRYKNDPCWPDVVWGNLPPLSYEKSAKEQRILQIKKILARIKS